MRRTTGGRCVAHIWDRGRGWSTFITSNEQHLNTILCSSNNSALAHSLGYHIRSGSVNIRGKLMLRLWDHELSFGICRALSILLSPLLHTLRRISDLLCALRLHPISAQLSLRLSLTLINLRPSPFEPAEPSRLGFLLPGISPRQAFFWYQKVHRGSGIRRNRGSWRSREGCVACGLELCFEVLANGASPDVILCSTLGGSPLISSFLPVRS